MSMLIRRGVSAAFSCCRTSSTSLSQTQTLLRSRQLHIAAAARTSTLINRIAPVVQPFNGSYGFSIRRSYASDTEDKDDQSSPEDQNSPEDQSSPEDKSSLESAQESASEALEQAKEAVSSTAAAASDAVSDAASAVTPDAQAPANQPSPIQHTTSSPPAGESDAQSFNKLFVGNLFFQTSENTLKDLFAQFGEVTEARIIYDQRHMSKGFGYIDFKDSRSADEAREALHNSDVDGRRIVVQNAIKQKSSTRTDRMGRARNPPAKTLFIGNMSYDMTDQDLNDLFKSVKNVLDVRVAIDRRTGQPRGFAHADFVDVESAQTALDFLHGQLYYGRYLNVDYTTPKPTGPRSK